MNKLRKELKLIKEVKFTILQYPKWSGNKIIMYLKVV